jgi:hypothetical protein
MNLQDLVVGRLYRVVSKKSVLGPEREEALYMFLRLNGTKAFMLSLEGEYKSFNVDEITVPRADYLEIFSEDVKNKLFPLMRQFVLEYQKYDCVRFNKSTGFMSKTIRLKKLNSLHQDINALGLTPCISKAVENYFNFYKGLEVSFNCIESVMINFLFIPEWHDSFRKLRGFTFESNKFKKVKLNNFSQDALILQHMYTNICLRPNFNNIKPEWVDLLITKIYYNGYQDKNKNEVIQFLSDVRNKCEGNAYSNFIPTQAELPYGTAQQLNKLNTMSFSDLIKTNQHKVNNSMAQTAPQPTHSMSRAQSGYSQYATATQGIKNQTMDTLDSNYMINGGQPITGGYQARAGHRNSLHDDYMYARANQQKDNYRPENPRVNENRVENVRIESPRMNNRRLDGSVMENERLLNIDDLTFDERGAFIDPRTNNKPHSYAQETPKQNLVAEPEFNQNFAQNLKITPVDTANTTNTINKENIIRTDAQKRADKAYSRVDKMM